MSIATETVLERNPWLRELGLNIYNLIVKLLTQDMPPEVIVAEIRNTDTWKTRFAGIVARQKAGLPVISEAEYLAQETGYMNLLRNAQVLDLMFDSTADFRKFAAEQVGGDVSLTEFSQKLDRGFAQIADQGPEMRQVFQAFYGVTPTDNALLLYFLDPARGVREIENQVAATIVGGEAFAYGLNVTRTRAELLASRGVSGEMARSGYADIAREMPQLETLAKIHRMTPLSQIDLEELMFHEDPAIARQRATIFQTAFSTFNPLRTQTTQVGTLPELLDPRRTV